MSIRTACTLLLCALLVAPAGAAETSWPIDLGEAGLTLDVELWKYTPTVGWAEVSAAAVTTTDLANGSYVFGGLTSPAAEHERFALFVSIDGSDRLLASYQYGWPPGTGIAIRPVYVPAANPKIVKQHDSNGEIALTVKSGLPASIADPSTSATFALWSRSAGAVAFSGRSADIVNLTEDALTGTYGATFRYTFVDGDLDTAGNFLGEFTVTLPDATLVTVPPDDRLELKVVRDFDGS